MTTEIGEVELRVPRDRRGTFSKITDQIVDEMLAWQSRPLDPLYAVLLIDCLVIKVSSETVACRTP